MTTTFFNLILICKQIIKAHLLEASNILYLKSQEAEFFIFTKFSIINPKATPIV